MSYKHLSSEERFYIEQRIAGGIKSYRAIAIELNRSHTTISREIRKNTDIMFRFYSGLRAHNISKARRYMVKPRVIDSIKDVVKQYIFNQLALRSSPEQIVGRLKKDTGIRISYSSLYRYIKQDKNDGGKLYLNLRHGKTKRKPSSKNNTIIKNKANITNRPMIAKNKQEPGHWEIDTIFGLAQKSYLLTLTDIATKYEVIIKVPNKEAATIVDAIKDLALSTILPFKTITSDNGTEFAYHEQISKITNAQFFFANPYSSWERGLNEHQNGLIRDFLPKKTDFNLISSDAIIVIQNNLNNRPRKSLNYLTPAEAMVNYVRDGKWCT